jgi:DNA-binding NarL/FixJ family response regulator
MNSSGSAQRHGMKWKQVLLSDGERQLARLVALGRTDEEIAQQLAVKRQSVEEHVSSLLSKIGGRERVEILFYLYSEPNLHPGVDAMARYDEFAEGCEPRPERKAS